MRSVYDRNITFVQYLLLYLRTYQPYLTLLSRILHFQLNLVRGSKLQTFRGSKLQILRGSTLQTLRGSYFQTLRGSSLLFLRLFRPLLFPRGRL